MIDSGWAALSAWVAAHWADIGLGAVAIALTMIGTSMAGSPLQWVLKRHPVEDDTHKLLMRGLVMVNGAIWAMALGFKRHFGSAIGVELDPYLALFAGTLLNSAAALAVFHGFKWVRSDDPRAKEARNTFWAALRKLRRSRGVTDEEVDAARTTRAHKAVTAEDSARHLKD